MPNAIKATEIGEGKAAHRAARARAKGSRDTKAQAVTDFSGKLFADLNGQEKDDLLKAVAISLGIIEG